VVKRASIRMDTVFFIMYASHFYIIWIPILVINGNDYRFNKIYPFLR